MKLRHLEWLVEERVANPKKAILCEILPYSPVQAERIIRHLCALAKFDLEQVNDDPARARRVRRAFGQIVDAARARQALLDLDKFERGVGKPPWRDRLRGLRHDRGQFATAIGDKDARVRSPRGAHRHRPGAPRRPALAPLPARSSCAVAKDDRASAASPRPAG
jgi:hypothetical protein